MIGIIYRALCVITGKSYIGQTIKSFEKRKSNHLSNAIFKDKNNNYTSNNHFCRALRKYLNESDWKWEILYENVPVILLNAVEKWVICSYGSYIGGYNSTLGGDFNPMECQEIRDKISKALKSKPFSKNHREALSKVFKKKFENKENTPMFGKHHSKEANLKNSLAHLGKIPWNKGIKCEAVSGNKNPMSYVNIIKRFNCSLDEAKKIRLSILRPNVAEKRF